MDNFVYANPVKVVFGPGEVSKTGQEAAALGKRALIVSYAEHDFYGDLLSRIETMLQDNGVAAVPFYEVTANPTMAQVNAGIERCKAEQVDLVIAVGGGSAMDAAKMIGAGVFYPHDPWKMIVSRHDDDSAILPEKSLPLLMVPTLPATSSEMNCVAVVTNEKTTEKSYTWGGCMFPKVSIVDPQLTCSLPAYQTGCGAADTISHALEAYLNNDDDTPVQDRMIEGIILNVMELAPKVLENPDDVALRGHLQWAAVIAWNGWTQVGIGGWAPMHQLGHVLSARHDLAHGASLAVIMPAWIRYHYPNRMKRCLQFAERLFGVTPNGKTPEQAVLEAVDKFEAFLISLGVPTRLTAANIPADQIDALTDDVVRVSFQADGTLSNNPPVDRDGVKTVFELAT